MRRTVASLTWKPSRVVTVSRLIRTRLPDDAGRRSGRRRRAALSFLGLRRTAMTQTMNTVLSEATPHLDRATVRTGPHSGPRDQPQSISL